MHTNNDHNNHDTYINNNIGTPLFHRLPRHVREVAPPQVLITMIVIMIIQIIIMIIQVVITVIVIVVILVILVTIEILIVIIEAGPRGRRLRRAPPAAGLIIQILN